MAKQEPNLAFLCNSLFLKSPMLQSVSSQEHVVDIGPQSLLCIYAIFPIHRHVILHNPLFRQKLTGRNAVSIPISRLQTRLLIMRNLLQYFSTIHTKSIHNKVNHPLLIVRERIFRSLQECETCIINWIIFEISKQVIHLRINRTVDPRPAVFRKNRHSIQSRINTLSILFETEPPYFLTSYRKSIKSAFPPVCLVEYKNNPARHPVK